jgi:hypothetical protein
MQDAKAVPVPAAEVSAAEGRFDKDDGLVAFFAAQFDPARFTLRGAMRSLWA